MYTWQRAAESKSGDGQRLRGQNLESTQKRAVFQIDFNFNPETDTPGKKRDLSGVLKNVFPGKIKAFLFRFTITAAVKKAAKFMERNLKKGFVAINSTDSGTWKELYDLSGLTLPLERAPRILLLVHGTFSNTISSFGTITETAWGKSLFASALGYYDAILGFNHPTLSLDPLENAQELLDGLQKVNWHTTPVFDIITHSRGGLVVRSLIEKLLPASPWKPEFNRVIFVACTNKGTLLAEPKNWETLINLYTNLTIGTGRIIGLLAPQTKAVSVIIGNVIENIADFLKYFADSTITRHQVPGLSAMEPDGEFIKEINKFQSGQLSIANSYYCAITSDFKPQLKGDHAPEELPTRFLQYLAGSITKSLMLEANDLVVNTSSMKAIDQSQGNYIKESFDFGENPQIYHTNYFTRPEVINSLARWLQLPAPDQEKKHVSRSLANLLKPDIDTDILITNATSATGSLREEIAQRNPSYIIVRKPQKGQFLHHAIRAEDALKMIGRKKIPAISECVQFADECPPLQAKASRTYTKNEVITAGNIPVGVKPEKSELPGTKELQRLSKIISKPKNDKEKVIRRRAMPSFSETMTNPWVASLQQAESQEKVTAYVRAEMDEEVVIKRAATVCITISREMAESIDKPTAETAKGEFDPEKKILFQVISKSNFVIIDEENGRQEIEMPEPGAPTELLFDLRATEEGTGEIWVVARQGQIPIIKLVLKPTVVKKKTLSSRKISADQNATEPQKLQTPLHQLWIRERETGNGICYDYQINSPGLRIQKFITSPPFKGDRVAFVQNLYKTIEERWTESKQDRVVFRQELRAYGADLFDELIPEELQIILWKYRNDFKSIQVISSEPFIPWELVHLKDPSKKGMPDEEWFLGDMGLIRWLDGAGENGWPPDSITVREGNVRYIIPDYPDERYTLPQAAKEAEFLKKNFKATMVKPESAEVCKLISTPGSFDLLHFAGHGSADLNEINSSKLLLEGRIENNQYVLDGFPEQVAKKFANLVSSENNRPIVTINACQAGRSGYQLTGIGGFANAFLSAGAGAFIGALWAVGDKPARTFTETLYTELLNGSNLSEATIKARMDAKVSEEATWLAYIVYGHPHLKLK